MRKEIKAPLRPEHLRIHAHTRTQVQHVPRTPHSALLFIFLPLLRLCFWCAAAKRRSPATVKTKPKSKATTCFLLPHSSSPPFSLPPLFSHSLSLPRSVCGQSPSLATSHWRRLWKFSSVFSHAFSINSSFFFFILIAFSHFLFCSLFRFVRYCVIVVCAFCFCWGCAELVSLASVIVMSAIRLGIIETIVQLRVFDGQLLAASEGRALFAFYSFCFALHS